MITAPMRLVHIMTVPQSLRFVSGQVGYMRARGVETHAVSSPGPALAEFGRHEECHVYAVEMPRRITPLQDCLALWRLCRYLRTIRPQIVHAHTPKGGLLGMLAARLAGVPVRIYHMHGLPLVTASGFRRKLLMATEAVSCRVASQVLCVSRSVRAMAVSLGLSPAEKIQVLLQGSCNGIDATTAFNPNLMDPLVRHDTRARYGIPADATVIGFVGRLALAKGLVELAEAWDRLRLEYPALHLLLIGPDEPGDPPPAEVLERFRCDPRVHMRGENWDTPPLYMAMDILALPTHREGFPVVLLEAAAMALAIVATRVTGCVDAVQDDVTGILVEGHNGEALAAGLRRYLDDPGLRQRHGAAARTWILREFSDKDMRVAIHQEYVRYLGEKGLVVPVSDHPGSERCYAHTSDGKNAGVVRPGEDQSPTSAS